MESSEVCGMDKFHWFQGEESMMFRSKFFGWDDIVPVDYTRTSESVQRVPDLKARKYPFLRKLFLGVY